MPKVTRKTKRSSSSRREHQSAARKKRKSTDQDKLNKLYTPHEQMHPSRKLWVVPFGTGGSINRNLKNNAFRYLVDKERRAYLAANDIEDRKTQEANKRGIALRIISWIHLNHGRFVDWDENKKEWIQVVDEKRLYDKTMQALRQDATKWKAVLQQEEQEQEQQPMANKDQAQPKATRAQPAAAALPSNELQASSFTLPSTASTTRPIQDRMGHFASQLFSKPQPPHLQQFPPQVFQINPQQQLAMDNKATVGEGCIQAPGEGGPGVGPENSYSGFHAPVIPPHHANPGFIHGHTAAGRQQDQIATRTTTASQARGVERRQGVAATSSQATGFGTTIVPGTTTNGGWVPAYHVVAGETTAVPQARGPETATMMTQGVNHVTNDENNKVQQAQPWNKALGMEQPLLDQVSPLVGKASQQQHNDATVQLGRRTTSGPSKFRVERPSNSGANIFRKPPPVTIPNNTAYQAVTPPNPEQEVQQAAPRSDKADDDSSQGSVEWINVFPL